MAAMKPRTGDGPLEVTKEGRGIIMRVPLEGGGRLVVELTAQQEDTGRAERRAEKWDGKSLQDLNRHENPSFSFSFSFVIYWFVVK